MSRSAALKEALELFRGPNVEPIRIVTPDKSRKWCVEISQAKPHVAGDRRKDLCLFFRNGKGPEDYEQLGIVIAMWEGTKNNVQDAIICSVEDTQGLQFVEYVLRWQNYDPSIMIASKVNKPASGKGMPTSAKGFGWILPSYDSLSLSGIKCNRDILVGFSMCRKGLSADKKPPSAALKATKDNKLPSRMDTNWLRAVSKKRSVAPLQAIGEPSTPKDTVVPIEANVVPSATAVSPLANVGCSAVVDPSAPVMLLTAPARDSTALEGQPSKRIPPFRIKIPKVRTDDSAQPSTSSTPSSSTKATPTSHLLPWRTDPQMPEDLKFNPDEEKKLAQETASKLEEFKRYYPMGVNWFQRVSIFDCEPAPANMTHRVRSNDHVQTLIKSFKKYPTEVLTPADLVPYDPLTRKLVTWSRPEELANKKFYIISGNHSIFAAQFLCTCVGNVEQRLEFAKAYLKRRSRVLNGNLSNKEYIQISIQCNDVIAETVYKEPLIEKLQQLRNQHKAFGCPPQGPTRTAVTSAWKDFVEVATTTLKVKELKDEKQFLFMQDSAWSKLVEVVNKWASRKLTDDQGELPDKPSKEFFNKTFLRNLRGMNNAEVSQLMDEILQGKVFLKVQQGYTGRFNCSQRALDIRTLSLMRREVLSYANSISEKLYNNFEELASCFPELSEQRLLDIADTDFEYVKANYNKEAVQGNLPAVFLEAIVAIMRPDEARKMKEKQNIVQHVTKSGILVSASVSENASLVFVDMRTFSTLWDVKKYTDFFSRVAGMTHAKVYHIVMFLRSVHLTNCLYSLSQIQGSSHVSLGAYEEKGWESKKNIKEFQYYVSHVTINRSDVRVLPVKPNLELRLTQVTKAPQSTPLPKYPITGDEDVDAKTKRKYLEFFTGKPKFSWAAMEGDFVLKSQAKTSYVYYIVKELVPLEGCVLDFFSGGTASRVALMQGKRSVAFEFDDKVCRFLRSFFEILEKMARPDMEEEGDEQDEQREEQGSDKPDINITQGTDLSNMDQILEGLDQKSFEERIKETRELIEQTEKAQAKLDPTFKKLEALNQNLDTVMPLLTKQLDKQLDKALPNFEYVGTSEAASGSGRTSPDPSPKRQKLVPSNEYSEQLQDELFNSQDMSERVQNAARAMDVDIPETTGYTEMDLSQTLAIGKEHIARIAAEHGVDPETVFETQ